MITSGSTGYPQTQSIQGPDGPPETAQQGGKQPASQPRLCHLRALRLWELVTGGILHSYIFHVYFSTYILKDYHASVLRVSAEITGVGKYELFSWEKGGIYYELNLSDFY